MKLSCRLMIPFLTIAAIPGFAADSKVVVTSKDFIDTSHPDVRGDRMRDRPARCVRLTAVDFPNRACYTSIEHVQLDGYS